MTEFIDDFAFIDNYFRYAYKDKIDLKFLEHKNYSATYNDPNPTDISNHYQETTRVIKTFIYLEMYKDHLINDFCIALLEYRLYYFGLIPKKYQTEELLQMSFARYSINENDIHDPDLRNWYKLISKKS